MAMCNILFRQRIGLFNLQLHIIRTVNSNLSRRSSASNCRYKTIIIFFALLISGIELNPGPLPRSPSKETISSFFKTKTSSVDQNTPTQTKRLRSSSSPTITEDLTKFADQEIHLQPSTIDILNSIEKLAQQVANQHRDLSSKFDSIHKKIEDLNKDHKELAEKTDNTIRNIETLELTISKQNVIITQLQNKVDDLENRTRRDNLIFDGIPKFKDVETWSECKKNLLAILSNHMDPSNLRIDRVHRIGNGKKIIAKIPDMEDRQEIFKIANSLRTQKIYINEDYSLITQQKRYILRKQMKHLASQHIKAKLRKDKLITDQHIYYINKEGQLAQSENTKKPTKGTQRTFETQSVQANTQQSTQHSDIRQEDSDTDPELDNMTPKN